jgi:ElaB/YqjD/DUF883 family membrane-anchored ribosome-binding protein
VSADSNGQGPASWAQLWSEFNSKLIEAGAAMAGAATPPEAARQWRSALLGTWAESWDRFLRSPEFRQWTQQSLSAGLQTQTQINQWAAQMQSLLQGVGQQDLEELHRALRRMERRLDDSIRQLSRRVAALARRVEAASGGAEKPARRRSARPAAAPPKKQSPSEQTP